MPCEGRGRAGDGPEAGWRRAGGGPEARARTTGCAGRNGEAGCWRADAPSASCGFGTSASRLCALGSCGRSRAAGARRAAKLLEGAEGAYHPSRCGALRSAARAWQHAQCRRKRGPSPARFVGRYIIAVNRRAAAGGGRSSFATTLASWAVSSSTMKAIWARPGRRPGRRVSPSFSRWSCNARSPRWRSKEASRPWR
jgi:hypothetical protein